MAQTRNRRAGVEDRWTRADGEPSKRHGKGLRWLGRYVDDEGHEHTKSFARKVDAKKWVDDQSAALVNGTYVDPKRGIITFSSYYREWSQQQAHWTNGTRAAMNLAANGVTFGDKAFAKLDESDVQRWVKSMADDGLEASTIRTRYANVRTVIRAAMRGRNRCLSFDPMDDVKLPRATGRIRIPTPDEVRALLTAAGPEFEAFVALCAFAGLRLGEAAALRVSDVKFLELEIHIEQQVQRANGKAVEIRAPKYDSVRTVATDEGLTRILARHVADRVPGEDPNRWMFPGEGEHPMHQNSVGYRWRKARVDAGLDWAPHLHDLRHFFASGLIASGCDVVTVQKALGHKSASVTLNTYSHLWPDASDRTRKATKSLMASVFAEQPTKAAAD